jgi:hypothetical protein
LQGDSDDDDLTGTLVVADKPIAVYSGIANGVYPYNSQFRNGDMMVEQLPPISVWESAYPRVATGDMRILAAEDNTTILLSSAFSNDLTSVVLNAGEFADFNGVGIFADKPVLVANIRGGAAASMSILLSRPQYLPSYIVRPLVAFYDESTMFVAARTEDALAGFVFDNGVSIDQLLFSPDGDDGFSAVSLGLTVENHVIESGNPISGVLFGRVSIFGVTEGYACNAGMLMYR